MLDCFELLRLLHLPGVGPAGALKIARGETPVPDADLDAAERQARQIAQWCADDGVQIVGFFDDAFPARLRDIPSPPAVLYVRGAVSALHHAPAAAVVGTRQPSGFGVSAAEAFTRALTDAGFSIVSGLALGVDTLAHQTALDTATITVATLACGADDIYPRANRSLAQSIVAAGGALVYEQPLRTAASAPNLIARNRLQTGLSDVTCIIQTDVKGGTMHAARFALAQGRPVLCPRPTSGHPKNRGAQALIDTDIAELPDVLPAFAQTRKLCREHAGRSLAQAVTREQLPAVVGSLAAA